MKTKVFAVLAALSMILPGIRVEAFFSPDDDESIDQFFMMAGSTGYILGKAFELAKEHYFRYVKVVSAEYTLGNQSAQFSCPLEKGDTGTLLSFQDEFMTLTISCSNIEPSDSDYIDMENYKDLFSMLEDDDDLSFSNDNDQDDDDDDDDWLFKEDRKD